MAHSDLRGLYVCSAPCVFLVASPVAGLVRVYGEFWVVSLRARGVLHVHVSWSFGGSASTVPSLYLWEGAEPSWMIVPMA